MKGRLHQKLWSSNFTFISRPKTIGSSRLFKILYISSTFTKKLYLSWSPFVEIGYNKFCCSLKRLIFWHILQNPFKQCVFHLWYVFFLNENIIFSASYFYASNDQLIFAFENNNCCYLCRFCQECAIELIDCLIDWFI